MRPQANAMHEQADKLIPELSEWNSGAGIGMLSWVRCVGRLDHAVAYAAYLWLDFVVHDDCVFLRVPDLANYDDWMRQCGGDRTRVESVMNHLHLAEMFGDAAFEPSPDALTHLGRLLSDMWSCKLRRDFPDRRVTVALSGAGSDELLDYEITVYQERD